MLGLAAVEVVGEDGRGARHVLNGRGEGRRAVDDSTRRGAAPGRRKGSGLGVYVRHLRDLEKLDYEDILQTVLAAGNARFIAQVRGWGEFDIVRLNGLRSVYADAAEAHETACPYGCRSNNAGITTGK